MKEIYNVIKNILEVLDRERERMRERKWYDTIKDLRKRKRPDY